MVPAVLVVVVLVQLYYYNLLLLIINNYHYYYLLTTTTNAGMELVVLVPVLVPIPPVGMVWYHTWGVPPVWYQYLLPAGGTYSIYNTMVPVPTYYVCTYIL